MDDFIFNQLIEILASIQLSIDKMEKGYVEIEAMRYDLGLIKNILEESKRRGDL